MTAKDNQHYNENNSKAQKKKHTLMMKVQLIHNYRD